MTVTQERPPTRNRGYLPNRRTILRASALLVTSGAGCIAAPHGRPNEGRATVSIVDVENRPAIPVAPRVSVSSPEATVETPPTLEVTLSNPGGEPVAVGEERAIVFAFVHSDEQPGLILLPTPHAAYQPVDRGCWRLADPVAIPEYYGVVELESGETIRRELGVWADPGGAGCLPTGRFSFTTTYRGGPDSDSALGEGVWTGRWGFSIQIE